MKILGFFIYYLDFLNSARPKNLQFYNEVNRLDVKMTYMFKVQVTSYIKLWLDDISIGSRHIDV